MLKIFKEKNLRKLFDVGVIMKGVDGVLELLGALLLFIVSPAQLTQFVTFITQHELSQDPNDRLANHLLHAVAHYSVNTKFFEAGYLFVHGLIKIFLVWGLLKNKLWAYPTALAFLALFMSYQIYRFTDTHSLALVILTLFDAIVFALTWHEYNFVRKHVHQ